MTSATLTCGYHARGECRSCTSLGVPYAQQIAAKDDRVRALLAQVVPAEAWSAPATGPDQGFRNKAKLAVGGSSERPTLGLTDAQGRSVDLRECAIQSPAIWEVIPDLAGFITLTGLRPYDVAARRGDLKFVVVTTSPDGRLMVRFVVRERAHADRIAACLPALLRRLPQVDAVSANLHPEHQAVLDSSVEVHLHGDEFFAFPLRERTLFLRHRSFFQTNTEVAQQLYDQVRAWADAVEARSVVDLYCGVGGFALHLAAPDRRAHGVEIEPDAVEAAEHAAALLPPGLRAGVSFAVGDATTALDPGEDTDLVVVNPPRRGLGPDLCAELEAANPRFIVYSSCRPETLRADLERLTSFRAESARLFDMFPQTDHSEVAVLLHRR